MQMEVKYGWKSYLPSVERFGDLAHYDGYGRSSAAGARGD
jgi:hypothetical protein